MNNQEQGFEAFLRGWAAEFARNVQSLEGEKPAVSWEMTNGAPGTQTSEASEGFFWWQQPLETDQPYTVWVGTPAQALIDLTSKAAETIGDRKLSYIHLLNQTFEGAAHVLSWGRTTPIVCGKGTGQDDPPLTPLRIATLKISLRGQELASLLLGAEPWFDRLFETQQVEIVDTASVGAEDQELKPFLERLIELELPVSIVLGRTVVALRDVLKFTAGSLIELDRHVGDPAEIVVSNAVVARGEVVSVRGNYGIRVQEVISRKDRIALQPPVRKSPV